MNPVHLTSRDSVTEWIASLSDNPEIVRFFSKINISDSIHECWEWAAGRFTFGYGAFCVPNNTRSGKQVKAHRYMFALAYPQQCMGDLFVLHNCDNPPCCNPLHLRLGTQQENVDDMRMRNRSRYTGAKSHHSGDDHWTHKHPEWVIRGDEHPWRKNPSLIPRGERHGRSKVSDAQRLEIAERYYCGNEDQKEIAATYGVDQSTIGVIARQLADRFAEFVPIRNAKRSRLLTFNGRTQSVKDWSDELGIKYHTIMSRLDFLKWDVDRALTTPVGKREA